MKENLIEVCSEDNMVIDFGTFQVKIVEDESLVLNSGLFPWPVSIKENKIDMNNTKRFKIESNGNVGIGSVSLSTILEIK